jgi:glutaredoxin-related protein
MAIIKILNEIMEWYDIGELKDYLIRNNIKYEDVEILSYYE